MKQQQQKINIIMVGDAAVGKTSFVKRYINQDEAMKLSYQVTLQPQLVLIKQRKATKQIEIDNKIIKIKLWDTSGAQQFKSITRTFYKTADIILLVYDITEINSFLQLRFWIKEIKENCRKQEDIVIGLLGNKCDYKELRKISFQDGQRKARQQNLYFMQVSARTGFNVQKSIQKFVRLYLEKNIQKPSSSVKIEKPSKPSKKCC